jgi:hypothetical protein
MVHRRYCQRDLTVHSVGGYSVSAWALPPYVRRLAGLLVCFALISCTSVLPPSASSGPAGALPPQRAAARAPHFEPVDFGSGRWFKGNTHTHTLESDGDSPPEVVVSWYRNHGYNFLVLSDHNVWVNPALLSHLVDSAFLLIPGEELTARFGTRPVHVNGLNIPHVIEPLTDTTLLATHLTGSEAYVRARVTDSGGAVAWLQPIFVIR